MSLKIQPGSFHSQSLIIFRERLKLIFSRSTKFALVVPSKLLKIVGGKNLAVFFVSQSDLGWNNTRFNELE